MNILVSGGTRYFGKHLVRALIKAGHDVTIATRGFAADDFGDSIKLITFDRTDRESIKKAFKDKVYDIAYDCINYAPNDTKNLLDYLNTSKYILRRTN